MFICNSDSDSADNNNEQKMNQPLNDSMSMENVWYLLEESEVVVLGALVIITYLVVLLVVHVTVRSLNGWIERNRRFASKRILLVIAHPDDEVMFFGPTILSLLKSHREFFYIICLSSGEYNNDGCMRKNELWRACSTLGILSENVTLLKYDHLRDDPNARWSTDIIRKTILSHINAYQIDTLITFDGYGVSGHNNHISIFNAVEELINKEILPKFCKAYVLESVNIIRKYLSGMFDLPISLLFGKFIFISTSDERVRIKEAMRCHESQLLWFRQLYLMFSRYLIVNTLRELNVPKGVKVSKTLTTLKQKKSQ